MKPEGLLGVDRRRFLQVAGMVSSTLFRGDVLPPIAEAGERTETLRVAVDRAGPRHAVSFTLQTRRSSCPSLAWRGKGAASRPSQDLSII
jgi:hypothetical protein